MKIYIVDDEPLSVETMKRMVVKSRPDADISAFISPEELIRQLDQLPDKPDIIFTDIEMPEISGFDIAMRVKSRSPKTRIVFVTGYSQYALRAYRMHVNGYILKPVTLEQVNEEIELTEAAPAPLPERDTGDKIVVRCFGHFEMFWNNEPITFSRSKTKELAAYLIDRRGEMCTADEIITALWEGDTGSDNQSGYLRALTSDLKASLSKIGMKDVLIRKHRMWAIRTDMLDCDFYRMLDGDLEALNSYTGEYMTRYSWAENTCAMLFIKYEK